MRSVRIAGAQPWIELPYELPLIDLARALAKTRLRLCWNVPARRLEVKAID